MAGRYAGFFFGILAIRFSCDFAFISFSGMMLPIDLSSGSTGLFHFFNCLKKIISSSVFTWRCSLL